MLTFEVFEINKTEATHVDTLSWDPETDSATTIEALKAKVLESAKEKNTVVSVNGPDAAWVLGQKKRRGPRVTVEPEVVKAVHQLYVEEGEPIAKIPFKLYDRFKDAEDNGLELKDGVVNAILKQERGVEVEGIDELREKATAMLGAAKKGRRKYTEKDYEEWIRLHVEEEMTGSAIAKKFEINSSVVNALLRERNVQRNRRG